MTKKEKNFSLAVTCGTFFALGIITAALGPVLPELAENAQTSLANIGAVFTAMFLGALISQLATGPLSDKIGQRQVLAAGTFLAAIGVVGYTLSHSLAVILAFSFLSGLGHGAVDLGGNVLISRVFNQKNVSALNLLNFFFGVGAFIGPALVSLSLSTTGKGMLILWIAAGLFILLTPVVLALKNLPEGAATDSQPVPAASVYRSSMVWVLGSLLLVYVGIETGLGGWITTYMNRTTSLSINSSALVSSGFWMALTFGRLSSALIGSRIKPEKILFGCFSLALTGGFIFSLSTGNPILTILAVLVIGFSFGAVYPTVMAVITTAHHEAPGKAASIASAMGSIGGMILPWMQGIILDNTGPAITTWFSTVGIFLMLVLFGFSRKVTAPQTTVAQAAEARQL
jgi:FHS family Na+ dependent glucose MFS transporter 1